MRNDTPADHSNQRKIIVLQEKGRLSRSLKGAVLHAIEYKNPNSGADIVIDPPGAGFKLIPGNAEVVRAQKGLHSDWVWESAFSEAAERPNTFIALEHGSVLRKRLLDIHEEVAALARMGNGFTFAHSSTKLFKHILKGEFCVLADEPLMKLLELLEAQKELQVMGLDVVSQETQQVEAQRLVEVLLDDGVTTTEISKRLGLNRSTIHRWKEKLQVV